MPYESVDRLQKTLSEDVFAYATDSKKAAGRALGTIVEIIAFYLLNEWGFGYLTAIETRLAEYGNSNITHNVEYSLHPLKNCVTDVLSPSSLPITRHRITKGCPRLREILDRYTKKNQTLLSSSKVLRNCCLMGTQSQARLLAYLDSFDGQSATISLAEQSAKPFAMVECKRVGVEEGNKKGPQTIEKAKQGAYVARSVSSLQKIRNHDGVLYGVLSMRDGSFYSRPHKELLDEVVQSTDLALLCDFILTIGMASNHGNWFTSDDPNKELRVLANAYDWLIFLTDEGLSVFIDELILNPCTDHQPIREAFLASYTGQKGRNQFTKVQMSYNADRGLRRYFEANIDRVESWFSILAPAGNSVADLKQELHTLAGKDWFNPTSRETGSGSA